MLIPIDKVVRDICADELGDTDYKHYMRIMRLANLAYKDLMLYVIPEVEELNVKSQITKIGSNYVVELPPDFVYYTKVGYCNNGRIYILGLNENLCTPETNDAYCDCPEPETDSNGLCCSCGYPFYNVYRTGFVTPQLYGYGGGDNCHGYYKFNKKKNRIELSSDIPDGSELIIEYKSDGVGVAGTELIPTECDIAVREFVLHRFWRRTDKAASDRAHRNYRVEYNRLKKFYSSWTKEEIQDAILRGTRSSPKR